MNNHFNIIETELERGATLIEASAGTGKTEAISGLVTRLVLQGVAIGNTLVVTYTEAATAELRERVRSLLAEALQSLRGAPAKTSYLPELMARHAPDARKAEALLEAALRDFDCAAIFTIHGFCQRALRENAFESQMLFNTELLTDEKQLVQETVEDFWRKNFYEADAVLVNFALRSKQAPKQFLPLIRKRLNYDSIGVISRSGLTREKAATELLNTFAKAKRTWCLEKKDILSLLRSPGWAKGAHKKREILELNIAGLHACLEHDELSPRALDCIRFLCTASLQESTAKKGPGTPKHRFFQLCDELCAREQDYVCALELDCLHFVERELARRKQRRNVQFFHDLLANLNRALQGEMGGRLAQNLREKYHAALIDEFQDTDSLQYQIFRTIFRDEENYLFLIGDPKQAIYGFRGADIFTYLRAFDETPRRFSLPKNYRSESGLVHAVNTFFQLAESPFVFPQITFEPVTAAGKADEKPLTCSGRKEPPLQLWHWKDFHANANKTNAEKYLPGLVAAEISRLLQADARIGSEKLRPKDFAVLVMENQQAQLMQRALAALNIPSVLHTNESLFATREAIECERLLRAVAEPGDERRIRAALGTDLLGQDATALDDLSKNEPAWHEWLLTFRHWSEVWAQKGFIQMFRTLLLQNSVRERLLKFPDGDRRLTNVLHLSETLHQAAVENKFGPQALLNWLADQMCAEGEPAEENQLRLERDEEAVQLVTIHKSKGLQYPIVFCPFSWKGARSSRNKDTYAWFHDKDGKLMLDVGSNELAEHRDVELRELVAERVRLLYVALTRARNRCYFVWGQFKDAQSSAPAYLLHQPSDGCGDMLTTTMNRFVDLAEETFEADLQKLVGASKDENGVETISLTLLEEQPGSAYLPEEQLQKAEVREFNRRIEDNWRITSFSAFVHGAPEESPDRDAMQDDSETDATGSGIFAIPPSSKLGLCMHGIYEDLDFTTTSDEEITGIVREKLTANGFGSEHEAAVVENVRRVLALSLDPESGLKLSAIPRADRLNELEFNLPVNEIAPRSLQKIFARHDVCIPEVPARIGKLTFSPVRGILKGFIDLVFRVGSRYYLLDWKTNWLGSRIQDYGDAGMRIEMLRHDYVLQYHLYCLALHKFLELRIPGYSYEQNFGGVFYIFLRGIDPARPESGVFRDRPAQSLIAALDEQLITRRSA